MGLGVSRKQLVMVAVLLSGALVAVLNMTLLTPALPSIMRDVNVPSTTVQWLTSGYALVEAVIIPLAAYMMGRLSTRKLFIGGIGLFGIGSLVAALAPSFPFLLLGRIIQAACTGLVMPMVFSVILLVFPREKRGSAMGIIGLVIGFAPTIGPSLSGVLVDTVGWRAIFVIVAVLAAVIVVMACFVLENHGSFKRSKFDPLSVVLSTVGLLSLLYGLSTFSSSTNHAVTVALVVMGLVVVGLYARRQLKLDQPMLRVDILKTKNYRVNVITVMIFQSALIGMETTMPLYIQNVLGHSATVSGMTLLPGALLGAFTGVLAGRLFDRHGVRRPVCIGAVLIVAAACGFAFLLWQDSPIWVVSAVYACMVLGMQFTMTPLNTWGVNSLPNDAIQHAQSTSNTLNQVAGSFGTALLVSIAAMVSNASAHLEGAAQAYVGDHASFCATALLVCVAVAVILAFVRDGKKTAVMASSVGEAGAEASGAAQPGAERTGASAAPAGEDDVKRPQPLVRDAMNPHVSAVPAGATMGEVIALMGEEDTTGVAVVEAGGRLAGYVTDGDVANYLARHDSRVVSPSGNVHALFMDDDDLRTRLSELSSVNVMELATKHVITVDADLPLDKACTVLAERKIKKMPVVSDGKLVGALSRRNVLRYLMK